MKHTPSSLLSVRGFLNSTIKQKPTVTSIPASRNNSAFGLNISADK